MAEFKIDGRMKVKKLKEDFFNEFGGVLRVYNGKSKADDDASLASIRANDAAKGGELLCRGNRSVKSFKQEMWDVFGIKVQVATKDDWIIVLDSITLSRIKDIPNYASKESMQEFVGNVAKKTKEMGTEILSKVSATVDKVTEQIDLAMSDIKEKVATPKKEDAVAEKIEGEGADECINLCEQIKQELKKHNLDHFIFGDSGFLGDELTEQLEERSNIKWADEDQNEDMLSSIFTVTFCCMSNDICDRRFHIWGISMVDDILRFLIIKETEDDNGSTFDDDLEELSLKEIYAQYSQFDGFDMVSVLTEYLDVIKGNTFEWKEK